MSPQPTTPPTPADDLRHLDATALSAAIAEAEQAAAEAEQIAEAAAARPVGTIDEQAEQEALGAFARARARVLHTRGDQARREQARRARLQVIADAIDNRPADHQRVFDRAEQIALCLRQIVEVVEARNGFVAETTAAMRDVGIRPGHLAESSAAVLHLWCPPPGYGRTVGHETRRVDAVDLDELLTLVLRRALPALPKGWHAPSLPDTPRTADLRQVIAGKFAERPDLREDA
ncbi:hypothetical protein [Frankia sp. AvcI1]|uniref:hypothetical protein n=1 Tax=Frankia sp. AvcI1 TaxID=573496 RepID=UPI0006EBE7AD|nr:hypothetical protein [Frankia sp. AvcI1]